MPDAFSATVRSYIMSRIRSRWTTQERVIHGYLKGWKVPHRMHPRIPGGADVLVLPNLVVYLHGCFWHGCPRCYVPPKSRVAYWRPKIQRNRNRDRKNIAAAKKAGYRVLELWEHDFKRGHSELARRILRRARAGS
jgi:DNA mismatch endonuclease (patch repair protein)